MYICTHREKRRGSESGGWAWPGCVSLASFVGGGRERGWGREGEGVFFFFFFMGLGTRFGGPPKVCFGVIASCACPSACKCGF